VNIIFSRKGFDQSSGGAPSPVIDGRPVSLPIPAADRSQTAYADLGLGDTVEAVTRGRIGRDRLCHYDPMFTQGHCAFGQAGAAQTHLTNRGVKPGDVFLFFGLFGDERGAGKHHRIFGYMKIERILTPGARPRPGNIGPFKHRHPHTIGAWPANNTIYLGEGTMADHASDTLRLTAKGESPTNWIVPRWLSKAGLSYHADRRRWPAEGRLTAASRGQEFVTRIDGVPAARRWLARHIEHIKAGA
jgi:hypothetical protein